MTAYPSPLAKALSVAHNRGMMRFALALFLALAFAPIACADQSDWRLNRMFERLSQTTLEGEAAQLESSIWQLWMRSENEDSNILMRLGVNAMNTGDYPAALRAFDRMVKDDPNFAEGWNKRATVHYLMDNYDASVADIERTLALEPRHFGALSGLGMINVEINNHKGALSALEAALKVHPYLRGARHSIEELKKKLLGSPT
ncbi:MAG: tetratricopeptide repeat protein [Alphaproteobacteria bacterium]|nr:tetratricopeptide repeat protein [Alphaproteobacteria bacterium]